MRKRFGGNKKSVILGLSEKKKRNQLATLIRSFYLFHYFLFHL